MRDAKGAAGLQIDPEVAADVAQACVVGSGGFVVVGWEDDPPAGADSEELIEIVEAAVETYLEHVEEHGDASGLLPGCSEGGASVEEEIDAAEDEALRDHGGAGLPDAEGA